MLPALVVLAALLGLAIGRLLRVVIRQVPRDEPVFRRVSSGAGRGGRTGPRYPAIEVATAALFALLAWHFGFDAALPAFLYLAAAGLALAVIDVEHKRLPFALTAPSYPVALVLLGLAVAIRGEPARLAPMAAGMLGLFGFYALLHLINPRGMGFGDVMLAGVLGCYLGYLGWGPLVVGAFLGFLFGAGGGLLLIAARRGGLKSSVPFGPYMLAGALVAILAGGPLAQAYLHAAVG
ncbi:MAG: A24 family peptidase [Actinomycetota bacterium]|nr:A24 family peptidase [Actinomycetota bacterium]